MLKIGDMRAINIYNPFLAMWTTITRGAKWYDGQLHPEEALTRGRLRAPLAGCQSHPSRASPSRARDATLHPRTGRPERGSADDQGAVAEDGGGGVHGRVILGYFAARRSACFLR